jgi:hypothetical protein
MFIVPRQGVTQGVTKRNQAPIALGSAPGFAPCSAARLGAAAALAGADGGRERDAAFKFA